METDTWKETIEHRLKEGEHKMNALHDMAHANRQALTSLAQTQHDTHALLSTQIEQTNRIVTLFEGFEDMANGATDIINAVKPIIKPLFIVIKSVFYLLLFIYFIFHFDWSKALALLSIKI